MLFKSRLSFACIIFAFQATTIIFAQSQARYTISGYIYEKGSRETLIGVNVHVPSRGLGVISNSYGYYAITLPADSSEIVFSYIGYQTRVERIRLTDNVRLDIEMEPGAEIEEVVITDERLRRVSQMTQMSQVEVPVIQARNIPALLGEKDMFKVLQLMPGVQSGTEGTSGFYVRGGGPDQNLIILDDAMVYNASHLFGFFSVFNGDAVKNMQLYKGGFPARYGGRLSSVLDIQMKDGNKEKIQGEAGIGLISSRLTLEGPVVKDKASFLVSGRRTYIDILTRPLMPKDSYGGYFFYDLNTKFNYDINPNNRIFASAYFGRDKFFMKDKYSGTGYAGETSGGLYWQNATATIRWNHIFNEKIFANTSLIFSDYTLKIHSDESYSYNYTDTKSWKMKYNSGIQDVGLKHDLSWHPGTNHHVRAGFQAIHHDFTPSAVVLKDDDINMFEQNTEKHRSVETGIYVEDEIRIGNRLKINPGIRFSQFFIKEKSYHNLEPRFSSNLSIRPHFSWKFSYASMNQYVHLLSTTGIGLPTDLWVPSTERIAPQRNRQLASGFAWDMVDRKLELSLEGYYKKSDNIIGYREGASFLFIDDPTEANDFSWQDNITNGEAWAYGLEFLVQRKQGNRLNGWIGYTLSWINHHFDELNFGEKFPARYDRRHDVSVVGIYEINSRITFSATWVYASGNAFDLATGSFPIFPHQIHEMDYHWFAEGNLYDKKNSFRAASYQRLDMGLQFHKKSVIFGNNVARTIEIGAYNAYNRKNPFFYYWESDRHNFTSGNKKLMQFSLFPVVPSISVNYKF
jgi:hypothetical protein